MPHIDPTGHCASAMQVLHCVMLRVGKPLQVLAIGWPGGKQKLLGQSVASVATVH